MPKVSVVYTTIRRDFPMLSLPDIHQFTMFLDSVEKQTFKDDIEVIIVDALKDRKISNPITPMFDGVTRGDFDFSKYSFPIKHIRPLPSYWLDEGFSSYCHCVNTGIIAADGELIVLFDDCSEIIGTEALELHWEWYKKGDGKQFARSIFEYWKGGSPVLHHPDHKTHAGRPIRHSAYDYLARTNKLYLIHEKMFCAFGYYSFSLDVMLELNGYNEMFDGAKGAEDFDMGCRLIDFGVRSIADMRLRVIEHFHEPMVFHGVNHNRGRRNNVAIHEALLKRGPTFKRANEKPLTEEEYNFMLERDRVYVPNFVEDEYIKRIKTHPPIFDLKDLRRKYREGFYDEK